MSLRRFAVFMGIAALVASSPVSAQESGIAVGTQAPGAKVQTLDGKSFDIGSYVGKGPMLIEFWAFWCPNCRELEPSLVALQKKYAGRVRFLAVAVSVNESLDRVKTYAARKGYKHETVYDGFGEATEAYDVPATSYVVVLDKTGKVVYTGLGGKQNLEPAILKALR
ncbi:MAG TPA: TlpA family protein disulfide reductase [Gemmatimonadaceae bacterium]|nr:TlpA family protein disulfide reductase [Gemmatimonadaceae bacterium]